MGNPFSSCAALSTEIHHFPSFGFSRLGAFRVLPPIKDFTSPRTKRGPGETQGDPPSKRGGRATTSRSSISDEGARVHNDDGPVLRDALGLPSRLPDAAANIAMMGTAGDDDEGHWCTDFELEEHRRPRITEPSTALQTGNEETDFGVATLQEEGLGLSLLRDTARARTGSAPPGFASNNALTALEVVDLMEKRLYARLPRLEESPKTYAEVELFLTAIEEEAEPAGTS